MRILKNYTDEVAYVHYGNTRLDIPAQSQADLALTFLPWQLAACEDLVNLLVQGTAKYQLNDGVEDLEMIPALDLIRGYQSATAKQSDGAILVAESPREGGEWVVTSHNFCDPCTWFGDSLRVVDEVLQDSGDGFTFTSTHVNWIDMVSGRQHNDDLWVALQKAAHPEDPHGYEVTVKVDGVTATMREPFEASGGDYEVLWDDGRILFYASQEGKVVTASYSYAQGSTFYVRSRTPGTTLYVENAEADISLDAVMTDAIMYEGWAYMQDQWVCVDSYTFKRATAIFSEARGVYPVATGIGASASEKALVDIREFRRKSRGIKGDRQSAPFNYSTARILPLGVEMRLRTKHGRAMEGENVTMTFYCTEK
jgi:hypothetical protein